MDFFERQHRARRISARLLVYFGLAVICIALSVYGVLAVIFLQDGGGASGGVRLWDPGLFAVVMLGTFAVIGLGSLMKIIELSKGGATVAIALGGRPLDTQTRDPDERKLLNVVEEMAIASGVPVPEVYVLPHESGINAFAAGHSTSDAVIGVTRGCLRLLRRSELQGVIAHEFSHILNGDMRLNLRLIGFLNGILCLALIGRVLLRVSSVRHSSSRKGGNPLPLVGLVLLLFGSVGVFFGRLIKSAVSRQREFLADAAAVQFTRNPDGLVGALKKIGSLAEGSGIATPRAEEASHLFFGNALSSHVLFSTHPPLVERIRVWEPNFDGVYPALERIPLPERPVKVGEGPRMPPILVGATAAVIAGEALASAGRPTIQHLEYARSLVASLPEDLRAAAHEPMMATALVCTLMLSPDAERRAVQMKLAETVVAAPVLVEIRRLWDRVATLDGTVRLPLVELCLPALRRLSPSQHAELDHALHELVAADGQIEIHEYALQHMLRRHLAPEFRKVPRRAVQYYALAPLIPELKVVLSVLAHAGHDSSENVRAAYAEGIRELNLTQSESQPLELVQANLAELDAALGRLTEASLPLKRRILDACARTVAADGKLAVREAELLRAIADGLDCPLPPFLALE